MFIAYTDASVQNNQTHLAFMIEFEDRSVVNRRVKVTESDNNVAEALAINELLSFLEYHKFYEGIILMDCNEVKKHLFKRKSKLSQLLEKNFKLTLKKLNVRTQLIPRKYNLAHQVCNSKKFIRSECISQIKRYDLQLQTNSTQFLLDFSAYLSYIKLIGKNRPYHIAVRKLNKHIRLGEQLSEPDGSIIYKYYNRRLEVKDNTIKAIKLYDDFKHVK